MVGHTPTLNFIVYPKHFHYKNQSSHFLSNFKESQGKNELCTFFINYPTNILTTSASELASLNLGKHKIKIKKKLPRGLMEYLDDILLSGGVHIVRRCICVDVQSKYNSNCVISITQLLP